jgi:hypothetical protein
MPMTGWKDASGAILTTSPVSAVVGVRTGSAEHVRFAELGEGEGDHAPFGVGRDHGDVGAGRDGPGWDRGIGYQDLAEGEHLALAAGQAAREHASACGIGEQRVSRLQARIGCPAPIHHSHRYRLEDRRFLTALDIGQPGLDDGSVTTTIDRAVDAFRDTLIARSALIGAADSDAAELGRRAALLVESAGAWRDHLGPLLDVQQAMDLLGVTTRQAVYDLVSRHRLLALRRRGGVMAFPAFQFDADSGRPYSVIASVLRAFAAAGVDGYTVATWLATAQDELDARTPVSLLADPTADSSVRAAAERTAARLATEHAAAGTDHFPASD